MKVGLIAQPWIAVPPHAYGGSEAVIDRLARGLQAAGHEVVLCASGDSECPVPRRSPLSEQRPDQIGQVLPELYHVLEAYDALALVGVDVIHDHTLAGAFVAPTGTPVAVTNHGPFDPMLRRLFAAIADRAAVVAISRSQARAAAPGTIRAVIHHGLDVEDVPVGSGSSDYLLHVGRMTPDKGVLEAIAVARGAGLPLVIAGKCREAAEWAFFEELVRPRLGGGIEFVGEVDGPTRNELMSGAMALLNPIQWEEPFGLVMIESLATGTPVVATCRGAAPEIVDDGITGFLAETVEDLTAAVLRAPELDRSACRRAVEHRFSTARMVDDHLALYRRLVGTAGGTSFHGRRRGLLHVGSAGLAAPER
ncbi:glycosyltransferase family 4 protein [Dermatobacter hominis]|uniref:glycosyltransferase family 4 protein n=1 Tax=Dermatobacter hominis TaxID=2884263 RepID=UPI001D12AC06|nr:glycosyltransferase family 4 protein [Dermatobacter hominis]UDY34291.1 glycosyltransferase family 4 protein [Dermatobacter hominis]